MFNKYKNIGICDIVLMLHELHNRGYQQLRLHSGWSPNGCCVRWNIYPKCVIEGTGSFERDNYDESPSGYHGSAGCPTNDLNPQEMADHFLIVAPQLCEDAKHPDEEYAQWFSILAEHAKKEEYPTAYGEFFPKGKGWIIQPGEQYIPYPPFVNIENIPLIEAWDKFSFTGRSWSYYLDKCIYFKGENECPPAVLKQGKEWMWIYEFLWVDEHFPYKEEKKKSCEEYFKKIIKEYKDLGLSHFRKHDGVCISLKAFLYKRYTQENGHTIDGFKQWYDNVYYAKSTPSSISRDYLLRLTLAYKGEEECPDFNGEINMQQIWFSESIVVGKFLHEKKIPSKAWGHEFYKWVARHIRKCKEPYDYMPLLNLYFQDFVSFKMKVLESM